MNESLKEQQSFSKSTNQPLLQSWVDEIFLRLHGRFGNDFFRKWQTGVRDVNGLDLGVENAKKTWGEQLSGFSAIEIKRGLDTEYSYLPDCDKFKAACRPSNDCETAYHEAIKQLRNRVKGEDEWSSPAIFWAATRMTTELNSQPYINIKNRWKNTLEEVKNEIAEGKTPNHIPEKKAALPAPGKTTVSKEESKKRFAEIHNILSKKISGDEAA